MVARAKNHGATVWEEEPEKTGKEVRRRPGEPRMAREEHDGMP